MRRLIPTLAPILVAGCSVGPAAAPSATRNVFGADDRQEIHAADAALAAIGLLPTGCTGTLIGKRLVLTAAHCVVDGTGRSQNALTYFRPAVIDGVAKDRYWIVGAWYGSSGKDWAIIKLDRDVSAAYKPFDVAAPALSALPLATTFAAYSSDRDDGTSLAVQKNCAVRAVKGEQLLNDCDALDGADGAPLFAVANGVSTIAGINVGTGTDKIPAYSDADANVALSAAAFLDAVGVLRATANVGALAPAIAGATFVLNTNLPDLDDAGIDDGGLPDIDDDGDDHDHDGDDHGDHDQFPVPNAALDLVDAAGVKATSDIRSTATSLLRTLLLATDSAAIIAGEANRYGDFATASTLQQYTSAASRVRGAIELAARPSSQAPVAADIAPALTTLLTARTAVLTRLVTCTPHAYCDGILPVVSNLDRFSTQLRRGLVR